mmetsp:Transcript_71725/g.171353  ORF Transcript_71725/g.171353 Transcript_71725/m.171353 type:complete len:246 (-) Transcript_71725:949-1686(-)
MVRRLIQYQQLRVLHANLGEEHAHALATGERRQRLEHQIPGHTEGPQLLAELEFLHLRVTLGHVLHRRGSSVRQRIGVVLAQDGNLQALMPPHLARCWLRISADEFDEGGLAGTILALERQMAAHGDRQVDVHECWVYRARVRVGDIPELKQRRALCNAQAVTCREAEPKRRIPAVQQGGSSHLAIHPASFILCDRASTVPVLGGFELLTIFRPLHAKPFQLLLLRCHKTGHALSLSGSLENRIL